MRSRPSVMTLLSCLVATPIAFVLPSKSWHVDAGKIILLGLLATLFFLFTSIFYFPGGANHFTDWANALVNGKTLEPIIASRDIAFPLLLVMGGYTIWGSFIGITLIHAVFAILMPVLIYWTLVRASPTVAFYAGVASIISLVPIYFLKWIHHDQTYIFFILLVIALLANFLQSGRYGFLYGFTVAALAASFSRQAGNLLFPLLLAVAYVTVRGRIIHYASCALIFVAAVALYQWHRYEIFDMRNQPSVPSYIGQQIFYNLHINSQEFGIRLSPDDGPNLHQITEMLRAKLGPNVRDSEYVKQEYIKPVVNQLPPAFLEEYILKYTPDELIERIYDAPNYEYYLLLASADPNDQHYLSASWEIARAHPLYIARYGLRNLKHLLFDPGYAHTRFNTRGFHKIGLQFLPIAGGVVGAESLRPRALREVSYDPLPGHPIAVQKAMQDLGPLWQIRFHDFLYYTSILIVVAWVGVVLRLLCFLVRKASPCRILAAPTIAGVIGPIIAASIFLVYNDVTAAFFAEPDYRYFHFTELLRTTIAGLAVALVLCVVLSPEHPLGAWWQASAPRRWAATGLSTLRDHDFLERYFGPRPTQWAVALAIVMAATFAWWASFMIERTW